jgi:hypothetical protein
VNAVEAVAAFESETGVVVSSVDRSGSPITMGHDFPCPWCGHSHHFLPCDDCPCPAHEHYPGEL